MVNMRYIVIVFTNDRSIHFQFLFKTSFFVNTQLRKNLLMIYRMFRYKLVHFLLFCFSFFSENIKILNSSLKTCKHPFKGHHSNLFNVDNFSSK